MNIEFYNCPEPLQLDTKILQKDKPEFLDYRPDFGAMAAIVEKYKDYKNILVIGHGGSVSSFYGFYNALHKFNIPSLSRGETSPPKGESRNKGVYFLSSVDPDYITELKNELSLDDTLVVAVSKSGNTVTQLEALSQFLNYPLLAITEKDSPLYQIAEKMGAGIVLHPNIGGRFTAFTETALLPALLCGLDVASLLRGAREMYVLYEKENIAYKLASVCFQLEQLGYVDVLGLIYSHYLFFVAPLITQLCHESFGKSGKGQTYLFAEGSEVQHHTVQRFLGGRMNMAGLFIGLDGYSSTIPISNFPVSMHSVVVRGHALFDLNKIPLASSQSFELQGTLESARLKDLPVMHMNLSSVSSVEVGRFVAFWQMFAVYSSILRVVNPFDQPEVEAGKQISFDKRLAFKGLM